MFVSDRKIRELQEEKECEKQVEALGKFPEKYYGQSPFDLSGGQKRRVAIAGVLAMQPKVLVLDEPTAGLDPKGRDEILDQIAELHRQGDMTVVLVSHSMEDIAKYGTAYCDEQGVKKCLTEHRRSFPTIKNWANRAVGTSGYLCDECVKRQRKFARVSTGDNH